MCCVIPTLLEYLAANSGINEIWFAKAAFYLWQWSMLWRGTNRKAWTTFCVISSVSRCGKNFLYKRNQSTSYICTWPFSHKPKLSTSVFSALTAMTNNFVFCFVLVRIDLFQCNGHHSCSSHFGQIYGQTGSKMAKNGLFGPLAGLVGPNWRNSVEQGWNKSGHIPGDALEPFWGSERAIWVFQRAPKRVQNGQKQSCLGHKQFWWLQNIGTVWNKGRTSQGTSPVMH